MPTLTYFEWASSCNQYRKPTMNYAIEGGAIVGFTLQTESLLDVITRRLRTGWRSLIDTLNQPGNPL
ncbi:protease FtsH-inhibitory lysogeny factor CIII [Erwinia aphidicola]|uniref:protease FtsH-inhibitory lysogeny factor CIII n=1 Tax=Erwinia aphidicola TaxID=68334 RepID=UPI003AFA02EC